jgi:hypothetical protein
VCLISSPSSSLYLGTRCTGSIKKSRNNKFYIIFSRNIWGKHFKASKHLIEK